MSDTPATPEPEATPKTTPVAPAGAENTVSPGDDPRIPKARFDEVNNKYREAMAELEQLRQADAERRQAEMTELERAQHAAQEAARQASELEQQLTRVQQERLSDRRNNAVANALAVAQAIDADETVAWLQAHKAADLAAAMGADGQADPDQIKKLVDLAKAERPHHFRASGPGSPSNRGGEAPQLNLSGKHAAVALTQEELDMARAMGFTPEEYAEFKR